MQSISAIIFSPLLVIFQNLLIYAASLINAFIIPVSIIDMRHKQFLYTLYLNCVLD